MKESKELPKGVCDSCWGKKYYTQMNRETGMGDFIGDPNYDSGSHIDKIPCSKCKGTGNYPVTKSEECKHVEVAMNDNKDKSICLGCGKNFKTEEIEDWDCFDETNKKIFEICNRPMMGRWSVMQSCRDVKLLLSSNTERVKRACIEKIQEEWNGRLEIPTRYLVDLIIIINKIE